MSIQDEILRAAYEFELKFETRPTALYVGRKQLMDIRFKTDEIVTTHPVTGNLKFMGLVIYFVQAEDHLNCATIPFQN